MRDITKERGKGWVVEKVKSGFVLVSSTVLHLGTGDEVRTVKLLGVTKISTNAEIVIKLIMVSMFFGLRGLGCLKLNRGLTNWRAWVRSVIGDRRGEAGVNVRG